ncbi:acetyl-CoA carboxylase biotin carboxyl carrier protein [Candidatus Nesciobacter abundans]|uniref:Biotin carboxyl carrier protein of acetyl-CoA carboxylase n=1 Tax=Candidatus Nesciobacter abundans TaxID=2601668 RepID=A0A5C0UGC5_9PROT|nr:biotin/lipoyl-containing protein [Candidatus Nesciobacter abundans]QEK39165.1 acetyl-CoA carboxylase biotin carboxyl carrier protein [Candidatus Nesciobacter abundans]
MFEKKIPFIVEVLKTKGLKEIEYKEGDKSIRITQDPYSSNNNQIENFNSNEDLNDFVVLNNNPDAKENVSNSENKATSKEDMVNLSDIKSHIVGIMYIAPSPGKDPFVRKGDRVKEGQTLFIIEAMKFMNEVKAEFSGTVEEILVEDSCPVEYGQVLARIKKDN